MKNKTLSFIRTIRDEIFVEANALTCEQNYHHILFSPREPHELADTHASSWKCREKTTFVQCEAIFPRPSYENHYSRQVTASDFSYKIPRVHDAASKKDCGCNIIDLFGALST